MDPPDASQPIICCPPRSPPDLDPDPPRPQRPEGFRIGGIVPGVDREERHAAPSVPRVTSNQVHGLRLAPMARREEIPDLFPWEHRESHLGRYPLDPPAECPELGRPHSAIVHGQGNPLLFQVGPGELRDHPVEDSGRRANPPANGRGEGMAEPETGPVNLETVAAAVDDSLDTHPACDVGEGPAGEDHKPDVGVARQSSERPPDRGVEPCRVGTVHDGRKRTVEVEDEEEGGSRFEFGPESFLERAEGSRVRREVAQRSLAPSSPTGKRDSSLSRWPAQR